MNNPEDVREYFNGFDPFLDWYYAGSLDGKNGLGNPPLINLDPNVQHLYV